MQSKMNILKTKSFNSKSHALSDYQNVMRAESSIEFSNWKNSLMDGIALSITGRSRISWENCSIQVTASVSLSILRFGEEKGRERVICCFIYGLILICAYSRESLAKLLINTKINQCSERGLQFQADFKLSLY